MTDDRPTQEASIAGMEDRASAASSPPFLHVVRGDPSPEEVAALVTVVAALGSRAAAPPRRGPEWSAHHRKVRITLPHGHGGWRSSALPR